MIRSVHRKFQLVFFCGALVGGCGVSFWAYLAGPASEVNPSAVGDDGFFDSTAKAFPRVLREVRADLDHGDYLFFPNRRSVWAVNKSNGRMALYLFHDDEVGSVDRSRVALLDLATFPPKDTILRLSDGNYVNVLWACNTRTGDVQMWHPGTNGVLRSENPISTSIDLMDRRPAAGGVGSAGESKRP